MTFFASGNVDGGADRLPVRLASLAGALALSLALVGCGSTPDPVALADPAPAQVAGDPVPQGDTAADSDPVAPVFEEPAIDEPVADESVGRPEESVTNKGTGAPAPTVARSDRAYPRMFREDPSLLGRSGVSQSELETVIQYASQAAYVSELQARFDEQAPTATAPLDCASPKLLHRESILPQSEVVEKVDGSLQTAGWIDQWLMDRCGTPVLFNYFASVKDEQLQAVVVLPPGDSLTDIQTVRPALAQVAAGARQQIRTAGLDCGGADLAVVDRAIVQSTNLNTSGWQEIWVVGGCGDRLFDVPLAFESTDGGDSLSVRAIVTN